MKLSLILVSLLALSGCAGLNVSWSLNASYNTLVQAQTLTQHAPAGLGDQPVPPPLPPGKPV